MDREYGQVARSLEGQPVYVIGGGPSLVDFDFDTLDPEITKIGANDAGRLSKADMIVTLDRNYYRHRIEDLVAAVREGRMVYAALPVDMPLATTFPDEIVHLQFKRGRGLSQAPHMIYGLNSGFAALNVAFLSGATDIRLLGFDFRFTPEQPHWHEEYHWYRQRSDHQIRRWARDFDIAAPQLEQAGVRVTNFVGENGSSITALPTRPLSEAI